MAKGARGFRGPSAGREFRTRSPHAFNAVSPPAVLPRRRALRHGPTPRRAPGPDQGRAANLRRAGILLGKCARDDMSSLPRKFRKNLERPFDTPYSQG